MQFVELIALRLVLLVGLPLLACVLIFGPARVEKRLVRAWNWFWGKRYEPEQLLRRVVEKQHELIAARRRLAERAESTLAELAASLRRSETEIANLETKAKRLACSG